MRHLLKTFFKIDMYMHKIKLIEIRRNLILACTIKLHVINVRYLIQVVYTSDSKFTFLSKIRN